MLDDNILFHPKANVFMEELASRRIMVNFTQTLDIHLVDKEKAKPIKKVNCSNIKFTRRNFHFSLNDNKRLGQIEGYHYISNTKLFGAQMRYLVYGGNGIQKTETLLTQIGQTKGYRFYPQNGTNIPRAVFVYPHL